MNKLYTFILISLLPFCAFGQRKGKVQYTFQEGSNVTLDGEIKEWNLYHPDSEIWSFGVSKYKADLYVAVRIKNEQLQLEALRSGIFVNISYSDKRKAGAQLVFPFVDREKMRAMLQDDNRDENNLKQDMLNSVRGYSIKGFSKVVDGILSLENQYQLKAFVHLDEKEGMIYEAKIPLNLIKFEKEDIAVQIGVNTNFMQMQQLSQQVSRPTNISGMYGRGPTMKNPTNPYKEETSVWFTGKIK